MRTGAFTVQQALTAEAATVLRLSLTLARRRGHAQVTPLHVAATLLSSSSYSYSSSLLRRACLKSQPHHPASHPLQCRALELCFNVALNRLPTNPPPSSTSSLLQAQPSLSNALIAALKRAQAHQRRGCIELQQQQQQSPPPPPTSTQQQQQPLLAIKVELEQLILSILDDPSVSRVMKEAGFSSTRVKTNLEEEAFALGQSSAFLLETWPTNLYKLSSSEPSTPPPASQSFAEEDLRKVLEIMLRKKAKKTSTVIVGDSVSMTEGLISELKARVERGEVPDELKYAQIINLQLSYVHLRLMSRSDVDLKLSELRRKISSSAKAVIVYVGDLRWAVEEEPRGGSAFKPVEHMVAELGRLLAVIRSSSNHGGGCGAEGKRWLLATSSFQTYMKCQMKQPSLEIQWALQAVVVPSGDLALSLQASSVFDSRFAKINQYPFQPYESNILAQEEEKKFYCCAECTSNLEKEASVLNSEIKKRNSFNNLPCWLQSRGVTSHHKDSLLELRKKWSRLCQSLHQIKHNQNHLIPSFSESEIGKNSPTSSHSWWSSSFLSKQTKNLSVQHSISFSRINPEFHSAFPNIVLDKKNDIVNQKDKEESKPWLSELTLHSLKLPGNQQVEVFRNSNTAQLLDSATSNNHTKEVMADMEVLKLKLLENIPWQSETIPLVMDALYERRKNMNGTWLLLRGSDRIAKRRLALVVADSFCGSLDRLVQINMRTIASRAKSCMDILQEALRSDPKSVFLMEEITQEHTSFIKFLIERGEEVSLKDAIFILTTSNSTKFDNPDGILNNVMKMRLAAEDQSCNELKRKPEGELQKEQKRPKTGEITLDLNLMAEEQEEEKEENDEKNIIIDDEEAVPSDLTHETDCDDLLLLPHELLKSIVQLTLETGPDRNRRVSESLLSKLCRAFKEVRSDDDYDDGNNKDLLVDRGAMEELVECSGMYLESCFEKWLREVFQRSLLEFKKGGKVRLVVEGKEGNVGEFGFMGSVLPNNVYVD